MTSDRPATERERRAERLRKALIDAKIAPMLGDRLDEVIAAGLSSLPPVRAEGETAYVKDVTDLLVRYRVAVRDFMHRRGVQSNPAVSDDWIINQLMSAPVRAEEPSAQAKGSPFPLEHTRSCPWPMGDEECTCGLAWRVRLVTEQQMHAAWRKRAEELERAALPPVQEPSQRGEETKCCCDCVNCVTSNCHQCYYGTHSNGDDAIHETPKVDAPSSPSQGARLDDLKALVAGAAITCESAPGDRRVVIRFGDNLKRAQALFLFLSEGIQ